MGRCLMSTLALWLLAAVCAFCCLVNLAQAQAQTTNITTHPCDARALNVIFNKWGISANQKQWNTSGELCSGQAIDDTTTIDHKDYNPFIKCLYCYEGNNKTICRITALKVYALNAVGEIPEELWTLTYLTNLNLSKNYLTGSLPPAIGNLTRMQYLTFGINALSGELPKELAKLTDLMSLSVSSNNFSGSLPSELGNLTKLEQIYLDSSGVSGLIPCTFANLKNLAKVWASDMELTGNIPDFIGNWTKLLDLRFEGNSFTGPIPSSFSNLTSITQLRISGLSNGSSSLAFLRNLTSLNILELRNNNISGSIPSFIGELHSLSQLFLGSNKVSGTLPMEKSSSLRNIDLSYNDLSGSLPSWVNQPNLQLNLVANNLTIEGSNSSGLPTGLNCIQKSFPCGRGAGIYYNFSIKCGGPTVTSQNGVLYEMDNETLGPATYYVKDTERWAVSNVGLFTGSNNCLYTRFVSNQFTGSLDTELFQTARLSASSLRYYGLGLENGNYNITLQFAETAILDNTTDWRSLGRRVFDIYIQGTRVLKDFDTKKEAGGISFRAVPKQFNRVRVSENYVEIHLFWAGKGTCCIPAQGTYGPLIQAISVVPDFVPSVHIEPPTSNKRRKAGLIAGIVVGVGVVGLIFVFGVLCITQRRKRRDDEVTGANPTPRVKLSVEAHS